MTSLSERPETTLEQEHERRQDVARQRIVPEVLPGVPGGTARQEKAHRTWGNKAFDLLVYPTIAFGAVFGFSVVATYQGKFGNGLFRKGYDMLAEQLIQKFDYTPGKAKSFAMVVVSFLAGTVLMAPIKWFEDSRQYWSKKLDKFHGTPADKVADAKAEPHQSWLSVLGGRVMTFGLVYGISKVIGEKIDDFSRIISNKITRQDIKAVADAASATRGWKISFISSFEAFYTALCATGVYLISRLLAGFFNKRTAEHAQAQKEAAQPLAAAGESDEKAASAGKWSEKTAAKARPEKAGNFVNAVSTSREGTAAQMV